MNHINKTLLLTGIAATLLAACSKESMEIKTPDEGGASNGLIALSSSVLHTEVAQSRAIVGDYAVANIPALDLYFARADEGSAVGNYSLYANTAFKATRATGKGSEQKSITWATGSEQYYATNGRNARLTAWYPGGATTDGETTGKGYYNPTTQSVTWTIDGYQDIMTTPHVTGNKTSPIGNIAMGHRLAAVQVRISAENTSTQSAWGNITRVAICNQRTLCVYNLTAYAATGAVSFKGSATTDFLLYNDGTGLPAPTSGTTLLPNTVLIEPQPASHTLQLAITTANGGTQHIYLTGRELKASTKYDISITLTTTTITLSASIVPWATPENVDAEVDNEGITTVAAIGDYYYTDGTYSSLPISGKTAGGLIFDRDPVDPKKYLVMGLKETNPITWAKSNTDCNSYTGENGSDPAGTWRLPTKEELQHLYCAIYGASNTTWPEGGNIGAPAPNTTAFANWNTRLKAIAATEIASGRDYWSSTEIPSKGYLAMEMKNGSTIAQPSGNLYFYRCIRNAQ